MVVLAAVKTEPYSVYAFFFHSFSYRLIHASANGHLRVGANFVPGDARRLSPSTSASSSFPLGTRTFLFLQLIRYRLLAIVSMFFIVLAAVTTPVSRIITSLIITANYYYYYRSLRYPETMDTPVVSSSKRRDKQ